MEIRHDWTRDEIHRIYHLLLPELIFRAQLAHRAFHKPDEIQLCRLLSIKTGGCPEDCACCSQSARTNIFATLFYAEYEPATHLMNYVNAGHNPPLVLRPKNGSCEIFQLPSTGIPVGISADSQFASATFQFEIDDVLVAYTDGITEAENRQNELWGQQRLETLLNSCCRKSPKEIINTILDQVSMFANGQPQRDDETLLVMRVEAGCDD